MKHRDVLPMYVILASNRQSTNETIRTQAEHTNTELEHTLNAQISDLQRRTIELEDNAEQVAQLQAYDDCPHDNEVTKEKSVINSLSERALVAMTIIAQTFIAESDSSLKQLTVLQAKQQCQMDTDALLLEEYKVGCTTRALIMY